MESLLEIIKYSTSYGFWNFVGTYMLFYVAAKALVLCFKSMLELIR